MLNYNRKILFVEMLQVQSDTIKELSCLTNSQTSNFCGASMNIFWVQHDKHRELKVLSGL